MIRGRILWGRRLMRWGLVVMLSLLYLSQGTMLSLAASLPPPANTTEAEVTFQNGVVTLAGTLILPETVAPHPAVIFVHGAHPNERGPYHDFAKYVFARYGVAALIYDKRGYGQ